MIDELLKNLEEFQAAMHNIQKGVIVALKNTEIPQEERIKLFMKVPEGILSRHDDSPSFPEWEQKYGRISWHNDFYLERYQSEDWIEVIQTAEEKFLHGDWTKEQYEEFVELILQRGEIGFTYDW